MHCVKHCVVCVKGTEISWESFRYHEQHQFWGVMMRKDDFSDDSLPSCRKKKICGHRMSLWVFLLPLLPHHVPQLKCAISHSNVKQAGQKENVWPTLAFVLIFLSNVQTLLPLGYLKWCGEDSQPLLSIPRQTHHQNTTSGRDQAGGWGGGVEMQQMFVWLLICGLIRVLQRQLELMAC